MKVNYKKWLWRLIPFSVFIATPYINWYLILIIFLLVWFIIHFIKGFFPKKSMNNKMDIADIENVALGIGKSDELEKLYKKLIKIVHEDKNMEKIDLAREYTQLLNQNRYNYNNLKSIEEKINRFF